MFKKRQRGRNIGEVIFAAISSFSSPYLLSYINIHLAEYGCHGGKILALCNISELRDHLVLFQAWKMAASRLASFYVGLRGCGSLQQPSSVRRLSPRRRAGRKRGAASGVEKALDQIEIVLNLHHPTNLSWLHSENWIKESANWTKTS